MIHPLIWISYLGLLLQNIFILWGCNEKTSISFSFFSVINVILWYPCVNKLTNVSISVLDLFKINNNFATTECKNALFLSLSFFGIFRNFEQFLGCQIYDWRTDVLTKHFYAIYQLFDHIDFYRVILYLYIHSQEGMIVSSHNRYLSKLFLHFIYDIQYHLWIFMV